MPGTPPAPTFTLAAASTSVAADSSEEERLVENICSRGGLRAQPDREALRLFVESLANLNGPKTAQQLQHKIVRIFWGFLWGCGNFFRHEPSMTEYLFMAPAPDLALARCTVPFWKVYLLLHVW